MKDCLVCKRISLIRRNKNKFFVKELGSGYVVIGDHQYNKGYTILLSRFHTNELHKLKSDDKIRFLTDMALVSEAVYKTFKPKKLNYELLGNTDSHLHWHIIPRHTNDPRLDVPIWVIPQHIRHASKYIPSDIELESLKSRLLAKIEKLTETRE